MTRKDEVGVDVQTHIETVTQASDTNNLETILQRLDAEMEMTTEDGYAGILRLDHTSVQVTTDGYATKTNTLSASRSYPNLSEADVSLIPKSIEDKGKTLTLGDVKWSESMDVDGEGNPVTRYTATASYTGTSTSRYATGYTVSANYTGEVSKANCAVVTYTAIFGSEKAPEESKAPGFGRPTSSSQAPYPSLHSADKAHSCRCSSSSNCDHYVGSQLDSFFPGSGEYLTPNLVPGALSGGLVNTKGSHDSPAQRVSWEKEEQGSERSFRRQAETELSGLCDNVVCRLCSTFPLPCGMVRFAKAPPYYEKRRKRA